MIRGLYSAASSLQAAELNHEVVAHNLAHANIPGYRRRVAAFESFDQAMFRASGSPSKSGGIGIQRSSVFTVFEPGDFQSTENSLDLALRGDGFFVVEGPNGPLYTRNGVFQLNAQGELQNSGGLAVNGTAGRISIPPNALHITVHEDGAVLADGTEIGRLKIAQFKDPSVLTPVGTTLFQAPAGVRPEDGGSTVHQGYREASNVQVVDEMVQMIAGMRQYEASQRALRALSEAIELHTRPQAG